MKVEVAVLGSSSLIVLKDTVSVDVEQHQKKRKKKYELSVTNVLSLSTNEKLSTDRSASYAGPSVWNNLPQTLRHSFCFHVA